MEQSKSVIFAIIFLALFSSLHAAEKLLTLEDQYKHAVRLEKLQLFPEAQDAFIKILDRFTNRPSAEQLPLAASTALHLSKVTGKNNYFNMHQLVQQIDSFAKTQDALDHLITVVPDTHYPDVLLARGANRIAWANKLLTGIPWKNYIVVPPADILGMVELGIQDLERAKKMPAVIEYYRSPRVKKILEKSKTRYTLEDILSSKNRDLFDVMENLVQLLGVRNN